MFRPFGSRSSFCSFCEFFGCVRGRSGLRRQCKQTSLRWNFLEIFFGATIEQEKLFRHTRHCNARILRRLADEIYVWTGFASMAFRVVLRITNPFSCAKYLQTRIDGT